MRRAAATTLAVAALLLSACDDGGEVVEAPTVTAGPTDDASTASADPPTEDPPTDEGSATSDAAPGTAAPTDDASSTGAPPAEGGEVEGGADGQAAADVAKEFFLASIQALPEACDQLVSFDDPAVPMVESESELELCREILPAAMEADVESQGLDAQEQVAILQAMQITGADVDGDTAVVDKDNLSPLFEDALGEEVITLVRIDDRWYVDLDRSFQPAGR